MRSAARIRRAHGDALPIRALCAHPHPSCPHLSVSHPPTLDSLLFVPRKSSFCLVAATVLLARQPLLSLNLPPPNLTRHLPPSPRNALFNCVRQIFPLSLSLSPPLSLSLSLHSELFLRQFVSSHFSPCSIPLSPHSPNPASPQGVNGRCDGMMSKRRSSVSVNDCQLGQTHCRKSERVWIYFFFLSLSLSDLRLYSVYLPIHALPPYMV